MPARIKTSAEGKAVPSKHGKRGNYRLYADVPADLKDALVAQARRENLPLTQVVRDALDFYLDATGATGC
jgi:hypothetical protein